jgi:hypothetical protein
VRAANCKVVIIDKVLHRSPIIPGSPRLPYGILSARADESITAEHLAIDLKKSLRFLLLIDCPTPCLLKKLSQHSLVAIQGFSEMIGSILSQSNLFKNSVLSIFIDETFIRKKIERLQNANDCWTSGIKRP